ncbi:MAG: hypothetical protein HOH88_06365 [Flavobacteriales bacterium]|jgi:hypothetical protein|nr:hypothetical protein [Flavobacteriales bacterium]
MKKLFTLTIALGLTISSFAQIQSLAGPRIGVVYITPSLTSSFLNGNLDLFDTPEDGYNETQGAITTLYGWQFESRFADGGDVSGIVEWIVLAGGMERGKFLPSISSMVGARTSSGLEFAVGPNLSLGGIAMVFGAGYNFKVGNLNMPVNFAFVPGRKGTIEEDQEEYYDWVNGYNDENGNWVDGYEVITVIPGYTVDYHTGHRFSITCGFNLNK